MSKYGKKFTCWSCGTRFYDLNKPEPKCPKCGADPSADPNAGGGGTPDDAEFGAELEEEVEAPDFTADEEESDDDDTEAEAEVEEEEDEF